MSNSNTSSYDMWNRFVDESQVNTKKKLSFKNELVVSLYEKYKGNCSIDDVLKFFKKRGNISAEACDANFWNEILYCVNLNSITIRDVCDFKQGVLNLIKKKRSKSGLLNQIFPLGSQQPKETKFGISPEILAKLLNNQYVKFYQKYEEICKHFRMQMSSKQLSDSMFNLIFGGIFYEFATGSVIFDILQKYCTLTGTEKISVTVDVYKNIFRKIRVLSIKDYVNISDILEVQGEQGEVDFDYKEKYIFDKLDSRNDTQKDVENFIDYFDLEDMQANELDVRLHSLKFLVQYFPENKLTLEFVINFAKNNLGLELSDLDLRALVKLLATIQANSITLQNFKFTIQVIRDKNFSLKEKKDVNKLRQLLCEVLRISKRELELSNVMDLFLLYSKMPRLCTESTLNNESLKLAFKNIKKIKEIDFNNKSLRVDKKDFREKFKKFVELFKDNSNKITFDNFKNLILAVPDGCLDLDCINCLLTKTDTQGHRDDLFGFFGNTLLTEKLDKSIVTWEKLQKFLSDYEFYNHTLQTNTFKCIIDVFIKNKIGVDLVSINTQGNKDKFREQFKNFVDLFVQSIESNKIAFDNFKNLILAVPDDCLDFDCINHLLQKMNLKDNRNDLCVFFESTLLKKISKYKFDLSKVRDFFNNYLSSDAVENYEFAPETFKLIVENVVESNKDCSCENEEIQWLLEKCCKLGVKLERDKFINLINKGKKDNQQTKVKKIKWADMYYFINKIVSPESGICGSGKIGFSENDISVIHRRSTFGFDGNDLSVFIWNIIELKKIFPDKNNLFKVVLSHIPYDGLPNLDVFRKVVYYCFEDVQKYDSDMLIPGNYGQTIDSESYDELLQTFKDDSLSYSDFKTLNSKFFSKQQSGNFIDLLFGLFSQNKTNTNIGNVNHEVLKKKLRNGTLSGQELKNVFSKFEDKKLSKENFIEILMLAQDGALAMDDFIDLFQKYCEDKIETENNAGMLGKIAKKLRDTNVKDLQDRLIDLNVEKGIQQLLSDIEANFSLLFKLTDKRLKDYGLSTLLNQENQENNSNNTRQRTENFVAEAVNNLDEGQYGTRMSIINFKKRYPDIWGSLKKEDRVYLQMILGYKQSLLLTIFCLLLSVLLFVPCSTICYFFGVFLIIYFLLELVGERTRNRLTEMVQGKSREASFWDKFFVWNKSVIEDARVMCGINKRTVTVSDTDSYSNAVRDSVFSVMMPRCRSIFDDTVSTKNILLGTVNRVFSILDRNVLS